MSLEADIDTSSIGARLARSGKACYKFGIVDAGFDYIRRLDTSFVAGGLAMATPGGAWQALAGPDIVKGMTAASGFCGDGRKEGNHGKGEGARPPLSMKKRSHQAGTTAGSQPMVRTAPFLTGCSPKHPSTLRGSFHAVFPASQSPACASRHPSRERWLGPSSRQSGLPGCETTDLLFRPIQVFKSEANSWSCRQPGPLVTHAPSLTIGNIQASRIHGFFYELVVRLKERYGNHECLDGQIVEVTVPWGKGVSSGIPTGMPVSEHSLGGLGYPPKWDKRVPPGSYAFCVAAALIDLIRPVPCTGEMEDGGVCRDLESFTKLALHRSPQACPRTYGMGSNSDRASSNGNFASTAARFYECHEIEGKGLPMESALRSIQVLESFVGGLHDHLDHICERKSGYWLLISASGLLDLPLPALNSNRYMMARRWHGAKGDRSSVV
ncbi:uncharacterized protein An06g00550 [Aspergillus niger]|uniref:Contig An06c0020, genomic contig n=2 Tax=Aspergillus niger TaxID=5061 RepID=A2QLA9_ASPNC|nr:uncharacterized protein An06g00550 [Aspergillus niger]CAK44970.1 unnamed protein product [Aspergillus niger]